MNKTDIFFTRSISRIKDFLSRDGNVALLLLSIALLTYALCLPNQMFWDDDDFILKNAYIQDWRWWPKFFTDNLIAGAHLLSNYWRPALQAVFAMEWHLWGNWAPGWHMVSIIMHGVCGVLFFHVINILFKNRTLAIMSALLWLVHPVHTEAVVYPNAMGDSLATVFVLLGIYFYSRYRISGTCTTNSRSEFGTRPRNTRISGACHRNKYYWLALAMYPLALLSKETGILLVAFIGLAEITGTYTANSRNEFGTCPRNFLARIPRILARLWPFILIAVIYLALRATVLNFNNSFNFYNQDNVFTTHPDIRLATFFRVIALYAGFIFTPYDLRVERLIDMPKSFFEPDVVWGMALCAGLIALIIRNWEKRPAVAFGGLWFFTAILPTSNLFVIINAMVYEHFIYTALIGIILIVLVFAMEWANDEKKRRILFAIIIALTLACVIRSAWRCLDWRTAIGFYEKLAPTAPSSYRVLNNLGMAYAEGGQLEKAKETYTKAIKLDPTNAVAYHNIANIYRDAAQWDLAQVHYEKAISLQPSFVFSYKSLAQIHINQGQLTKARRVLEIFFNISDEKVYTLNILAELAFREKAYGEAKRYLMALLQLIPGDPNTIAALQKLDGDMYR